MIEKIHEENLSMYMDRLYISQYMHSEFVMAETHTNNGTDSRAERPGVIVGLEKENSPGWLG